MITHVLDTDHIVAWLRGDQQVERLAVLIGLAGIGITSITLAELYYGAHRSARRDANLRAVQEVRNRLVRVPLCEKSEALFGEIKAELEQRGTRLDDADLMIAASALAQGAVLVTNNVSHFARVPGLTVEDWLN